MDERLLALADDLQRAAALSPAEFQRSARRAAWLSEFSLTQFAQLLRAAAELPQPLPPAAEKLLAAWLPGALAAQRQRSSPAGSGEGDSREPRQALESLYRRLPGQSPARGLLLAWLAGARQAAELGLLAELLVTDPPDEESQVMQALAPVFQTRSKDAQRMFPRLLDGLRWPHLAAPVLDLANFLTREKVVAEHPAQLRGRELTDLLGQLAQSLASLEDAPATAAESAQELSRRVAQGVALAVALCDTLALMNEQAAVGKLYQALAVRHRRLKTEAAAALARLGEEQGRLELIGLAAEPTARLRVLAYAQELGLSDRVDPQFTTPLARAEAELCVWLAEPTQYGVPPTTCELVDHRRQSWPGFAAPVECFLFRFQYVLEVHGAERSYSNIGIAGPLVHAFLADLGDQPLDDIYAAFAGWQAQHEEIREYDVARLSASEKLEVERLKRKLHDAGFTNVEPQRMGYFFGEKALVATAARDGVAGIAIADFLGTEFFPPKHRRRPLGVAEAYAIYKGRRLLKTFNRAELNPEP